MNGSAPFGYYDVLIVQLPQCCFVVGGHFVIDLCDCGGAFFQGGISGASEPGDFGINGAFDDCGSSYVLLHDVLLMCAICTTESMWWCAVFVNFFLEMDMRPVRRSPVNKGRSAKKFRRQSVHTKAANVQSVPRGGFRL